MDENEVIHNTDGYGALDLGATEIVGSLEALEALMEIRSSVHGIQEPVEVFTTIDAEKVPILIGVKTLEKMGALIDVCGRWLVLSAISPEVKIPLAKSRAGHLLVNLAMDWLNVSQPLNNAGNHRAYMEPCRSSWLQTTSCTTSSFFRACPLLCALTHFINLSFVL